MIAKIYKIIFFCFIIFYQNVSYSKNLDITNFNEKNIYNYFSALVSLDNNQYSNSLKFFNSSKFLKQSYQPYINKYLFSLILNGKITTAIKEIKTIENKKFTNFFEANLLLLLDSLKKRDYEKSAVYIKNLKKHEEEGTFEFIISSVLEEYTYLFNNNKINQKLSEEFGNLSLINRAFQNCYLGKPDTEYFFEKVINSDEGSYSRYLFFYINFLISKKNFADAENVSQIIDPLNSTLLIAQTKDWIQKKNFENFEKIFSCQNSNDIIGEFFFLISNLYSSEGYLNKSNFYFNLSNYFNPKFKFNLSLLADNYYKKKDFKKTKKILNNFNKRNEIYYWYKIKKTVEIIKKENDSEQSFNYIESEFNKIEKPSLKITYDMGNIAKSFKKYNLSIKYYSKVLSELDPKSLMYADILYRRGGSYERIGNEKKSDEDLLKSLQISPNEPHVLNYLAYSWLERNYKINIAMDMLKQAYEQRKNDPYIIDSIGWAYYLIGDYVEAERLLKKAVQIMPRDPVVNDHYGDILWKLGKKIQANYFWKNVLTFKDTENKLKEEIYHKLLKGPKKI